jgi:hypothetical protein
MDEEEIRLFSQPEKIFFSANFFPHTPLSLMHSSSSSGARELHRFVPLKPLPGRNCEHLLLQGCRYYCGSSSEDKPLLSTDDYERFGLTLDALAPLGTSALIGAGSYGSVFWKSAGHQVVKLHYAASRDEIRALVRELIVGTIVGAGLMHWLPDRSMRHIYDSAPFSAFIYTASAFGVWTPSEADAAELAARMRRKSVRATFPDSNGRALPRVDIADLMERSAAEAHRRNVFKTATAKTEPYSVAGYVNAAAKRFADEEGRLRRLPPSYFFTSSKLVPSGANGTVPGRTFGNALAKDPRFTASARPVCGVVYCTAFILSQLRAVFGGEHRDLSVANIVLAERAHAGASYKIPIYGEGRHTAVIYDADANSAGLVPIIIDPSEMRIGAKQARLTVDDALRVNQVAAYRLPESARDSAAQWIAAQGTNAHKTFSSDMRRLWLHITTVLFSVIRERTVVAGASHGDAVRSIDAQLLYLCLRFTFVKEDEWRWKRESLSANDAARVDHFFQYSTKTTALLRTLLRCHKLEPVAVIGRDTLLTAIDSCKTCIDRILDRLNLVMDVVTFPKNSQEERFLSCDAVINWAPLTRMLLSPPN